MASHPENPSRRRFLRSTSAALATVPPLTQAAPADEPVPIAFIGPGGMGLHHIKSLCQNKRVQFRWIIDPDSDRTALAAKTIEEATGQKPKIAPDLRRALDDPSVSACFIATPDHWHAPATLLAASAGKHVYVEKPCSHNLREGRLMIEAASKHGVRIQVGTQNRSAPHVRKVIERIAAGAIGEVLVAKAWNSQLRSNQGHHPASQPPPNLDYDLWLGPVPEVPFKKNYHPGSWRWFRHFGSGDIGNDGVHDIDIARWGLAVPSHPSRISAMGQKLHFDDDQEWPDTVYACFEYDAPTGHKRHLIYEQRIWSPYVQEGQENGSAWYGTQGMIIGGKSKGWQIFGPKNRLIETIPAEGNALSVHHDNFFAALHDPSAPLNADIVEHHPSTALCHLANIALRTGRNLTFDPTQERFSNDEEANQMLSRSYRPHWATPVGSNA
jgi:predicted dehydrogenase